VPVIRGSPERARFSSSLDSSLGAWFAAPIAATHGSLSSSCSKRADQKITLPLLLRRVLPSIAKVNLSMLIVLDYAYAYAFTEGV
jgi:hypothetical protein